MSFSLMILQIHRSCDFNNCLKPKYTYLFDNLMNKPFDFTPDFSMSENDGYSFEIVS